MDSTTYFLLGDVARILRCQPYQIVYLLTTGKVPEPALRIGNKRIFTLADVHRIAERLKVHFSPTELTRGGKHE
jgi:DNA-binding transcriptional MerR regulator